MWNDHHGSALFSNRNVSNQHSGVSLPCWTSNSRLHSSLDRVPQLQNCRPLTRHEKSCPSICLLLQSCGCRAGRRGLNKRSGRYQCCQRFRSRSVSTPAPPATWSLAASAHRTLFAARTAAAWRRGLPTSVFFNPRRHEFYTPQCVPVQDHH